MKMINKGFTLVELLVTLAVISIVVVVSSDFFFNLIDTSVRVQNRNQVEQDYNFVATKITKLVQDANSIEILDYGNQLNIIFPDKTIVLKYYEQDQTIKMGNFVNDSITDESLLVSSGVKITKKTVGGDSKPIFESISPSSNPQQLRLTMVFNKDKGIKFEFSSTLERTITVRKSYKN